jgi:NAD(P)-dependent dehydrogenase (short-subunit alcohol dehydrogenase family)
VRVKSPIDPSIAARARRRRAVLRSLQGTPMQIQDRSFLVTGGASGLGAATAEALVAAGGRVLIADLSEAGGALADRLGSSARFVASDVTDATSVQRAIDAARERFGGLHGAVGCAGIVDAARVVDKSGRAFPADAFQRVVEVNLVGMFNLVRLAAAAMTDNAADADGGRGAIVMTSSIAAYDGQIGQSAYAASKAGVAGLTLPLARDLAGHGIRVVTIAPGIFDTAMMAGLPEEVRQSLGGQTPFPARLGKPSEFADLVLHALENAMLNGEVIRLDGAIRMGPR